MCVSALTCMHTHHRPHNPTPRRLSKRNENVSPEKPLYTIVHCSFVQMLKTFL